MLSVPPISLCHSFAHHLSKCSHSSQPAPEPLGTHGLSLGCWSQFSLCHWWPGSDWAFMAHPIPSPWWSWGGPSLWGEINCLYPPLQDGSLYFQSHFSLSHLLVSHFHRNLHFISLLLGTQSKTRWYENFPCFRDRNQYEELWVRSIG